MNNTLRAWRDRAAALVELRRPLASGLQVGANKLDQLAATGADACLSAATVAAGLRALGLDGAASTAEDALAAAARGAEGVTAVAASARGVAAVLVRPDSPVGR